MIHFITNKQTDFKSDDEITVYNSYTGRNLLKQHYENYPDSERYCDTETNGLDAHANTVLLFIVGNKEEQIVIDTTSIDIKSMLPGAFEKYLYIFHNAKFDYKMIKVQLGIELLNLWDTMGVEQKIYQGALANKMSNPDGIRYGLKDVIKRRFHEVPLYMNKDIRNEFINVDADKWIPKRHQVLYGATDITYLPDIYDAQLQDIRKYKLDFYVNCIGNPLLSVVGNMEIEGQTLNTEWWTENIKDSVASLHGKEVAMDEEVKKLRDTILTLDERKYLRGGKFDRKRNDIPNFIQSAIEYEDTETIEEKRGKINTGNINWNSATQFLEVMARLKCEVPVKESRDITYATPTLLPVNKKGSLTFEIDKRYKYTTAKTEIEAAAIERPDSPASNLLKMLTDYRHTLHDINSFGYNFLKNTSSITGKIHSFYRIEDAITGRFQSGDSNNGYFNSQNIPRDKKFRRCFSAGADYSITTSDLSGAEVTIMCDKAHDEQLYQWAVINDDAHSPIATACWKNIFLFRAGVAEGFWYTHKDFFKFKDNVILHDKLKNSSKPNAYENYNKYLNFVINKKENKPFRDQFKSMTFGTVYGMFAKKGAKTLNIPVVEAEIVIQTIKLAIPNTFKYVESNVDKVLNDGYLILDDRTNSRIWFPAVIRSLRDGTELSFNDRHDAEGVARNSPFQGTQASMIKEAMVEIHRYFKHNKIDAAIINMVHDELVVRQPHAYDGKNGDKKILWFSDVIKKQYQGHMAEVVPFFRDLTKHEVNVHIDNGLIQEVSIPEFVKLTMSEAANRYLTHYKMGAAIDVEPYWTK